MCAFKMYQGATVEELQQHCSFRCHTSRAIVISEVSEDTYVITHPPAQTKIRCPGKSIPLETKYVDKPGALQIQLPCNCSLYVDNKKLIPARFPCAGSSSQNLHVMNIVPATWTNLKSFHFNPLSPSSQPIYANISECLNTNWTIHVPHINLSTTEHRFETFQRIDEAIDEARSFADRYGPHSDTAILMWNMVLTIMVLRLICTRNRLPAVLTAAPLIRSAEAFTFDCDYALTGLVIFVTVNILLIACSAQWFYKRRRNLCRQLLRDAPPRVYTLQEILQEGLEGEEEEATLTFDSGRTARVRVESGKGPESPPSVRDE